MRNHALRGTAVRYLVRLALALVATCAEAGGFSFQSEHDKLADHVIVYAGLLTEERNLQGADLQGSSWKSLQTDKLYKVGGYCFYSNFISGYSPAMIVVDQYNQTKVAVFNISISDIEVKLYSVQLLSCNDISKANTQRMLDKSKGILEDMERQRQRNLQMMKELQESERKRKSQQ